MRRFELAVAPWILFVLATTSCDTTTDDSALPTATAVTSIYLDPAYFIGDVPCAATTGAMQSYVAHLYDVTTKQIVSLSATPAITCSSTVTFQQVAVGRRYRVKIDGYDVPASQLQPIGGPSSGSHTMTLKVANGTGPIVEPRWSTACNDVTAAKDTRVTVNVCTPFPDSAATTGVQVDPRVAMKSATPALTCQKTFIDPMGNNVIVGDVHSFHVRPDDPSLPTLTDFPCVDEGPAPPAFTQGIRDGQTYDFRIEAVAESGGPVLWGSSCFGTAKEGLIVDTTCDPLRADGAMDVVISADKCNETDAATYDVEYAGPPKLSSIGVACGKSVRLSPLDPGLHAATVVGYDTLGTLKLEATCSATVEPGKVSTATCIFF